MFKTILMSFLIMNALVAIGDREFEFATSLSVKTDVKEIGSSADIELPRNYRDLTGERVTDVVKAGMPVKISVGYNGVGMSEEFTGFVRSSPMASDFPLVIKCDQLYKLRQSNYRLSYRAVTLKKLLNDIAPEYTVEGVDFDLGKLIFSNQSTYQIIAWLKQQYGMYTTFRGNVLHCGFCFDFTPGTTAEHVYTIGRNVKDYQSLKYETDKEFSTRVEIDVVGKDGKKQLYKFGPEGENVSVKKHVVPGLSAATAQAKAESLYKQYTYDGYSGTVTGFYNPIVRAGDNLTIVDKARPEREGKYLVEAVELKYSQTGIERTCTLGLQID